MMATVPARPKIYHITHVDNIPNIVKDGVLWSDAKRIELGIDCNVVGMADIKWRRLNELNVKCYPDTMVGDYVPFNFCSRSVMLYILHMGNLPGVTYRGGQQPLVHLRADFHSVVAWAQAGGRQWAISDCNAGAVYANFFSQVANLDRINWSAVAATQWRDPVIKERKQAEFLAYESFPWSLVERIGVFNARYAELVNNALGATSVRPPVAVERDWYY